ncbi:hypothetical protein PAAG_08501 [Paracoccidioides lutzii Pb01]|uniref:Uncharacterized protein n=1 Tax=Paracoccidioides lutzii (strain ATCC MYA-826 / Pb01) TaxID=502779 RepID=C1HCL0_PARBA|nr:hypothetical protein PAAG_08501 [Paracoccidioides lutzii Pb01]EEH38774.2 hypothetical protein PAAG_08501 [Paracoccidioides lutzii Pb01]
MAVDAGSYADAAKLEANYDYDYDYDYYCLLAGGCLSLITTMGQHSPSESEKDLTLQKSEIPMVS